jgi:acyl carrier protein
MATNLEDRITEILLEYAEAAPAGGRLDASLSLRRDLEIESLSLVALVLRIGDELQVDLSDAGIELAKLNTVGDLFQLGRTLSAELRP